MDDTLSLILIFILAGAFTGLAIGFLLYIILTTQRINLLKKELEEEKMKSNSWKRRLEIYSDSDGD